MTRVVGCTFSCQEFQIAWPQCETYGIVANLKKAVAKYVTN